MEALEDRTLLASGPLYAGGLEFNLIGTGSWSNPISGGNQTTSSEVQVGLQPAGNGTFTPELDVTGGVTVNTTTATAAIPGGGTMKVLGGATILTGAQSFNLASGTLSPTNGGASSVKVAGFPMTVTQLALTSALPLKATGSVAVDGFNIPISSGDAVLLDTTGVSIATPFSISLGANSTATIGGMTFKLFSTPANSGVAVGATAGYDPSVGFYVDGSASFSWGHQTGAPSGEATNDIGLSLGTPAAAPTTHGLVFSNGTLSSIDASINGNLSYRGFTFSLNNLSLNYMSDGSGGHEFTIDGGATLAWKAGSNDETGNEATKDTFNVTLGDAANNVQGIVVDNGKLTSLDASVTGSLSIKDTVTLTAKNLTLTYGTQNSATNFAIYGDAGVTVGSGSMIQSVDVTLGSATQPGLVITGGDLSGFNITVNGAFNLGGLSISPQNLTLAYSKPATGDPRFQITGGLEVDLTDKIKLASSIGSGTPLTIDALTGVVDLTDGFSLAISADIGGFDLEGSVSYTVPAGGGYDVVTNASLTTPSGIGFQAYLDISNGQLNDIGIGISGPIEVGDTGLTITWIFGSLQNINTNDPTITAAATLEYGDFGGDVPPILEVTGAIQINKEELLVSADPNNLPSIYSSGIVSEADHPLGILLEGGTIGQFYGSVDLNWSAGVYTVEASGSLLDGMCTIDASMTLTGVGDLSFSADVGINVPDAVPVIGGDNLGSMHVRFEYKKHAALSDDYIAAWGSIPVVGSAGFEYTFNNKFKFLDGSAIAALVSEANAVPAPSAVIDETDTINVPIDTSSLQYTVSDPLLASSTWGSGAVQIALNYQKDSYVKITDPYGEVYYGNMGDASQNTYASNVAYNMGGVYEASSVPSFDFLYPYNTPQSQLRSARVFSFNNPPGEYLVSGTWTFQVYGYTTYGQLNDQAFVAPPQLKTHLAISPAPPRLRRPFLAHPTFGYYNTAPTATQTDLDKINVSVPVDVYEEPNTNGSFSVSLYASNTLLTDSTNLTTAGADPGSAGTLLSKQDFNYASNQANLNKEAMTFSASVLTSHLPTAPDGVTPVHFYVVVDDGINSPVRSPASNAVVPVNDTPVITAPAVEVLRAGQGFNFNEATGASIQAGNYISVNIPAAGLGTTSKVTVVAGDGSLNDSGTANDLFAVNTGSGLAYTAPSPLNFDTITVTATFTGQDGDSYTSTRVIQILPPNNVDLGLAQDIYGPPNSAGNLLASTDGGAVSVSPASSGATLDFRLKLNANATLASTATTANGVTVQYALPPHTQFVSAAATEGSYNPATGIWTVGNLTSGSGSATLDVKATVMTGSAGDAIVSAATVVPGTNGDGTPQVDVNPANEVTSSTLTAVAPVTGYVYLAIAGSGISNPLNVGAANVTVELIDDRSAGGGKTVIGTTTTNEAGYYSFGGSTGSGQDEVWVFAKPPFPSTKPTSTYSMTLTQQNPYAFQTTMLQPSKIAGIVTSATGNAGTTLPSSAFSPAGGALVYLDLNNDGQWDAGDPSTTTDISGHFSFNGLGPGTYTVRESLGAGRAAVGAGYATVSVGDDSNSISNGLAFEDQRTVWGYQFADANGDATDDAGDTGQAGWTFTLSQLQILYGDDITGSTQVATTTTDASGLFQFANLTLAPGTYDLHESARPGYTATLNGDDYFQVNANGTITTLPNGVFGNPGATLTGGRVGGIAVGDRLTGTATSSTAADHLVISAIATLASNQLTQFTVKAVGSNGQVDPNYAGTVQFATDDPAGFVNGPYTFLPSDRGAHTFSLRLMTTGTWTVNVIDTANPGTTYTSDAVIVSTGQASQCVVVVPTSVDSGQAFSLALHPVDAAGNAAVTYWGTAEIGVALAVNGVTIDNAALPADLQSWIEAGAGLPTAHHFSFDDHGTHAFALQAPALTASDMAALTALGVSPTTPLTLVVHVIDPQGLVSLGNVSVAIVPVTATPTPVTTPTPVATPTVGVTFQGPTQAIAGTPTRMTVGVAPAPGVSVAGSVHTIHFTSTDPAAVLPPDITYTVGGILSEEFVVTFVTPGDQTVTATDTANGAVVAREVVAVRSARVTASAKLVDTVSQVLVGQAATAKELAVWGPMIAKGASPARLVAAVTRTAEYTTPEVTGLYEHLLGRAPTPAEAQAAASRLDKGVSIADVEVSLLGGEEFYGHVGGDRPDFLADLALDLLGRRFTANEARTYAARLAHGATRQSVALAVLDSPSAARFGAAELYDDLLFRAPTPKEVARLAPTLTTAKGRSAAVARVVSTPAFRSLAGAEPKAKAEAKAVAHPSAVKKAGFAHTAARLATRLHGASGR